MGIAYNRLGRNGRIRRGNMTHTVIYDGNCNLCSNLVQVLEQFDRGQRFQYIPMQDAAGLSRYQVTPEDCEMGMILIQDAPPQRWQGSDAAEEIGRLLPVASVLVNAYRSLPGLKGAGDRAYIQVRDNRYNWFGRRETTYQPRYPACDTSCAIAPWQTPSVIQHSQNLINSFQHWTGRSLVDGDATDPIGQAKTLFTAPFVVVSHGTESDPIFNYGNQTALDLWEFDWAAFTQLPSRLSAEPIEQDERDRLLAEAKTKGYISDYQGVRISRSGKRFRIEQVILWDVLTADGENGGQAAMFAHWQAVN
jgi:predicted DCC family thiol-disulfide oxidoreductase YuxK